MMERMMGYSIGSSAGGHIAPAAAGTLFNCFHINNFSVQGGITLWQSQEY
jgi:hypothetical protein